MTSIGSGAFADCSKVSFVNPANEIPPSLGYGVFNNCPLTRIDVPEASIDAYKTASGWKTFASFINIFH